MTGAIETKLADARAELDRDRAELDRRITALRNGDAAALRMALDYQASVLRQGGTS